MAEFVPTDFDPASVEQIETLCRALIDRSIGSADDLRTWMADLSTLEAALDEHGSRAYIDNTCYTEDKDKEAVYLHFIQKIVPVYEPLMDEL